MISVGCRAGGNKPGKVPGSHSVGSGPANTDHGFHTIDDLAGPHITDSAAGATGPEKTGGHSTIINAVIGGAYLFCQILVQKVQG
jgi:hypothetical protein